MKKIILPILVMFSINANALEINNNEPYKVVKGDTLWDISEHFLKDPWEWTKIWKINSYIKNPNLIYPDDIIKLVYNNGRPSIVVEKNNNKKSFILNNGVEEITEILSDAIPSVNYEKISYFNNKIYITKEDIKNKVLKAKNGKTLSSIGDEVIVKIDGNPKIKDKYNIVNFIEEIKVGNKEKTKIYDIVAEVEVESKYGDFYIVKIIKSNKEVKAGNLIVKKINTEEEKEIFPSRPPKNISGEIAFAYDRINTYKDQIVILNKGFKENISEGDIVLINGQEENINVDGDNYKIKGVDKGLVFIYKVEDNLSYGIVVKNDELIKKEDSFKSPF